MVAALAACIDIWVVDANRGTRPMTISTISRDWLRRWLRVPSTQDIVAQVSAQLGVYPATGHEVESSDPEHPASWLSLDYVHERVLEQLKAQNDRWEAADGRLRLILGLIGVVFAVTIGLIPKPTSAQSSTEQSLLPFLVGAPAFLAVATFLVAGLIAVVAWWPLEFDRPPAPDDLRSEYLTTDPRETKLETIDTILVAYANNERVLEWKFRAFKVALVLTSIATGLFGAAAMIQLLLVTRSWG